MASSPSPRTKVFISYSHADKEWLERLKRHLKPLIREDQLDCWDDTHIRPGDDWRQEIRTALDRAQVAVLLISADFFASDFIDENELPPLLDAAQDKSVRILPVILSASRFARDPSLARFQAINSPGRPLNEMPLAEQEKVLDRLAQTIEGAFNPLPGTAPGRLSDVSEREMDANRYRMLAEVRRIWIDGYLKDSLYNLARIELGLEEIPDAVSRPWDLIVQPPDQAPRSLPPGQAMGTVFDELGQALLILGAPGAGKTTLLLELTRDLLDRAAQGAVHPIPVVFHLASWAVRRHPLADWLVDELTERYYVPRKLAQAWIAAEQVLPLLDGLDEVAPEHRAACVEAINTFRRQHAPVPLAVCSRALDYQALPVRVELSGAVVIQPLSREQVGTYLKQAGKALTGVRAVLREDDALWELLETPLMLSIVALAYQGRSAAEVRAVGSLEQRRTHLFANYTERMFNRRTKVIGYSREQITCWLNWLARSMINNNLSVFYLEWVQPDWLPSRAQRWIVTRAPLMFIGLAFGLILGLEGGVEVGRILGLEVGLIGELVFGLAFGLAFGLVGGLGGWLILGLAYGLATVLILRLESTMENGLVGGLVFGLIVGLVGEFFGKLDRITPVEALRWSWRGAGRSYAFGLVLGLLFGLVDELGEWLILRLGGEQAVELISGPASYMVLLVLVVGLIVGLGGGLVGKFLGKLDRIAALRWSWRGARRSCAFGLAFGLTFGLVGVLKGRLAIERVIIGLAFGPTFGLAFGLVGGLVGKFLGKLDRIAALRWSWRGAGRSYAFGLILGLLFGLVGGLGGRLIFELISALAFKLGLGLVNGLAFGLVLGLVLGLVGGLTTTQIITRTISNEGIRRSLQNASINILAAGSAFGLVFEMLMGSGLLFGLLGGLVLGLKNGGAACLQHYLLRFLLWRNDYGPWNYIRFLDYAAERVFLRKVGGGYIFTHRLLMEYFATLQPTVQAG